MSNFIKIVRNYEHICRVGKQIIDHKDLVRRAAPSKLDEEFKKQEERIQEFVEITNKAHEEWKKNPYSVNEYWTGWS
tara:strand:- start:835 stop:1065 length:231 start_codon:yes stop_codon:yes gene_type:complete